MDIVECLKLRGVKDTSYLDFVNNANFAIVTKPCSVDGYDFMVDHMLDDTNLLGVGLVVTNNHLQTKDSSLVAIAVVEGDDVLCIDTKDQTICLWLIQNGDGECIKVASDFSNLMMLIVA